MTEKPEFHKISIGETVYETTVTKKFLNRKKYVAPDPNCIKCVIPGVIQKVYVKPGQKVRKGEPLCILEAMKMQNDILAPFDGRVKTVDVEVGKSMMKGQTLMELVPSQPE